MRLLAALVVLLPALAFADGAPARTTKTVPTDAECPALPPLKSVHIPAGEMLDYDIDVLAANAARMEVETLPREGNQGAVTVRVRIKTNSFFNKVRRVKAEAKSYLSFKNGRPLRYTEDAWEDDEHKVADVNFHPAGQPPQTVQIR